MTENNYDKFIELIIVEMEVSKIEHAQDMQFEGESPFRPCIRAELEQLRAYPNYRGEETALIKEFMETPVDQIIKDCLFEINFTAEPTEPKVGQELADFMEEVFGGTYDEDGDEFPF